MTSSGIESARRRAYHLAGPPVDAPGIGATSREELVHLSFQITPSDVMTRRRHGDTALTPEVLPTS